MIHAVLFDYDGVLSVSRPESSLSDPIAAVYGKRLGWDKLGDLHHDLSCGKITSEAFFRELAQRHDSALVLTAEDWHRMFPGLFERSQPVYELAAQLRGQGIRTGIVSNTYAMTADEHRRQGNYDGFDPTVLSCEHHVMKPDVAIYQIALQALQLRPETVLYIDDREKCLVPALALGMRTLFATDPEQIIRNVKSMVSQENGVEL